MSCVIPVDSTHELNEYIYIYMNKKNTHGAQAASGPQIPYGGTDLILRKWDRGC